MTAEDQEIRYLYVTDNHQRGTAPRCRIDNYHQTQLNKIAEVGYLAQKHQVTAVLHGGDIHDSPLLSVSIFGEFVIAWMKALAGIPIWVLPGNHDEIGHNPLLIHRTMLGLGSLLGFFNLLDQRPVIFEKNGFKTQVTGAPYHFNIDKQDPLLDYVPQEVQGDRLIHIAHGMLVREQLFEGAPYTALDAIWDKTAADLTLAGHNHLGFPLTERNGRVFYNPGAMVRQTKDSRDINRQVKAVLVTVRPHGVELLDIPLMSARPASEVLNPDVVEDTDSVDRAMKLREFIESVRNMGSKPGENVLAFLDRCAEEKMIEATVVADARRRFSEAYRRLQERGEEIA